MLQQEIWTEKYRPKTFNDFVGIDKYKSIVELCNTPFKLPHFLFVGRAGIGKTTFAKIIIKALNADYLLLNASDETGIDTIRGKVKTFAKTLSLNSNVPKIVFLDEADFLCLDPNTEIIIGTIDKKKIIKIKDVPKKGCNIVSFDIKNKKLENDYCIPLKTKLKQKVYKIELIDGRIIEATNEHPFFIIEENEIKGKKLKDLKENDEIIDLQNFI